MKLYTVCAAAALALSLTACGGKKAEDIKAISDVKSPSELTPEQIESCVDWALELQNRKIAELEEKLDNVESDIVQEEADKVALNLLIAADMNKDEIVKAEAYKDKADEIKKNNQKIEQLADQLKDKRDETRTKLGFK